MSLKVAPTTPKLGATVTGIDLGSITADQLEAVNAAILEHKVLFFEDQHLSPESQLDFARHFGEIDVAPFGPKHPDFGEMTVLDQVAPKNQGADAWHTDNTYLPCPPSFTIPQSVKLPELGGDTCFADMYAAFDALSTPLQALLCELTATHDLTKTLKRAIADGNADVDLVTMQQQWPPVHHPVVRAHPDTGRRALFVNGNFTTRIDGLTDAESEAILSMLLEHIGSPALQCRHRWKSGTLTMWDNRCVQHYAVPDYTTRRVMHRLTVSGTRPTGPAGDRSPRDRSPK